MSQRDLVARLMLLGAALLLSACAGQPPLPAGQPALALPLQLHVQQSQDQQRQDWVLVIQREEPGIRWSMMDLLGIPRHARNWSTASGRLTACCRPTRKPGNCSPRYCLP